MQDDRFEWDDAKARANLRKHKIDFEVGAEVFDDLDSYDVLDDREDYGEDRWITIGVVGDGRMLAVTHVERAQRHRIISARKATKREQDDYYSRL